MAAGTAGNVRSARADRRAHFPGFAAPPEGLYHRVKRLNPDNPGAEKVMPEQHFEEAKAVARLPNLDVEIIYSRSPEGEFERLSISLQAAPSFEAFGRYVEALNPFLFWTRFAQSLWQPWLGTSAALLPYGTPARLPSSAAGVNGSSAAAQPEREP